MDTRIRVRSTRAGYNGRPAGKQFDVTAAEFVARGPDGDGMLEVAPGTSPGATPAAIREAARAGVDLGAVKDVAGTPRGKRVTAKQVREAAKSPPLPPSGG